MAPMYDYSGYSGSPYGPILLAIGIVAMVLGFAIIRWITRDPEDGSDHWRSHRH